MSWLWPDFINEDLSLERDERKAVEREAWRIWRKNPWNIALYVTTWALYIVGIGYASDGAGSFAAAVGAGGVVYKGIRAAGPVLWIIVCFRGGGALMQRARFAPCIYEALRRRGYEVCGRCGYWQKGLVDNIDRCPECGEKRESTVKRIESEEDDGISRDRFA